MKFYILLLSLSVGVIACNSNSDADGSAQTFCDTTCNEDTFMFNGDHKLKPYVSMSVENCTADTLTFGHEGLDAARQMHMGTTLGSLVRLNKAAIDVYFKDADYAWLKFNDCTNGRGYLMQLPFDKSESVRKMSSAINSFDKKFVLPDDMVAYADYSTIYVEDVTTGKKEMMTFKEEYKINFNNIHNTIDSVNITHDRIFVQLIKDGKPVQLEKAITLQ